MRTILIVDRPGLYLEGMRLALTRMSPERSILIAHDLEGACRALEPDGTPELALIDVDTPGLSWDVVRSLRHRFPRTRLAAMRHSSNRADAVRAMENGLAGYISKSQTEEEILGAISDVLSGRIYVARAETELEQLEPASAARASTGFIWRMGGREERKLTPRQLHLLPLLAEGLSNKEIARALNIAEGTAKIHAASLLRVLGVRNRVQAAVAAHHYLLSTEVQDKDAAQP